MSTIKDVKDVLDEMKTIYPYSDEKCQILVTDFDYENATEIRVSETTENGIEIIMIKKV